MTSVAVGTECSFVSSAKSNYDIADNLVRILERQRKGRVTDRRNHMNLLRNTIQNIENNLWEALARDYPRFRFRRENQTIVVNYSDGSITYVNPGEVYKIKSWGVNDYYEALDTVNRLQNRLWNNSAPLDRRFIDDWKRLQRQLNIIDRRNCKNLEEVEPGPIVVVPPPTIPCPPYPPGPDPTPVPLRPFWSSNDRRNWGVTGWTLGGSDVPGLSGTMVIDCPTIALIDGREFIFYKSPGVSTVSKLVWLLHGNGGSARSWFTDYENVKYIKKLLDAGYAVCAYDSYNRISRRWTLTINPETNREIVGLRQCQNFLVNYNLVPATCTAVTRTNPYTGEQTTTQTCVITAQQFAVGMSSGANMASYSASTLGFSKVILHNAAGVNSVIRSSSYNAKTLWMVSANDIEFANSEATDNYNYLLTNRPSLTPAYYSQAATKITSAIFDDIPGISTVVADAIIAGLVTGGFIESNGTLTSKYSSAGRTIREQYLQNNIPTILIGAFSADQESYRKYANDIIDQIKISFSDHEFSGWQRSESGGNLVLTDRDLAFLNS